MKISEEGLELIMRHEGFRAEAYRCPAGVWTIGYGHTGPEVVAGSVISQETAKEWLRKDVEEAERVVAEEHLKISQHQFDALVSFVFNVGAGNFRRSALLKMIRINPLSWNIRTEFAKWNKARGSCLPGLILRRKEEIKLYFNE